ncbi:unnamed protein product [Arabidopsis thaliana]|uniref:(thale cress) hypothetical protein n=1 Tax=Arabidopsis thaliana TaxID=3702 RepID=A0A178V4G7_ARATH|nr:hypothetical protein AXX17_AT4G25800 [Arabidopsis thaliana]CAD5328697.1 unnamed protein product [Arabidopsis thaliana]
MGSLKLSTVVVTALVVCLSILLISPTEAVEGKLKEECENVPYGFCPFWLFNPRSEELCKEKCKRFKSETSEYYGGFCTPNGPPGGVSLTATCNCCVREKVSPPEIEAVEGKLEVCDNLQIAHREQDTVIMVVFARLLLEELDSLSMGLATAAFGI